jgi:hypothetical protein
MVVSTPFVVGVFLLGAATGVLLKRSQWAAFKELVRKDLAEQIDAALGVGPVLGAAAHSDSGSDVELVTTVPAHSDLLPDCPERTSLKQTEMEIALIRSDVGYFEQQFH